MHATVQRKMQINWPYVAYPAGLQLHQLFCCLVGCCLIGCCFVDWIADDDAENKHTAFLRPLQHRVTLAWKSG